MHFIEGRALPPQVEPKEGCFLPFPLRNGPMEARVASCLAHDTIHLHGGTCRPSVLLCVSSKIGWVSATEFLFGILAVVRIPVPQIRASYSFPFPISFLKLHQSGQPNIRAAKLSLFLRPLNSEPSLPISIKCCARRDATLTGFSCVSDRNYPRVSTSCLSPTGT
ncbi:hypothetical protein Naga_100001g76 [Nannochloropsis gaditana]|uniref:Uncharacterized protein n=1 Tax=Nannochloropsis gaditana TaxID=72520 RepID=W7TKT5_9STRA|nr:hypothetical protein Naga_100001g76 [Nannochloropsis gaditana]